MASFTFLEINLDGAEFNAAAPFSDTDAAQAKENVAESVEERFDRVTDSPGSGPSPVALLAGLVVVVGVVTVARRLRSRQGSGEPEREPESPIVAD